jgi:hypothetical protein
MSFDTVCFSIYSDISTRIMAFSSPKTASANALHSSVLADAVGPRNRKLPDGALGVLEADAAPPDGAGYGRNGLVLADSHGGAGSPPYAAAGRSRPPSGLSRARPSNLETNGGDIVGETLPRRPLRLVSQSRRAFSSSSLCSRSRSRNLAASSKSWALMALLFPRPGR